MNIFHIIIIHNYLEHMVLQDHLKLPLSAVYLWESTAFFLTMGF